MSEAASPVAERDEFGGGRPRGRRKGGRFGKFGPRRKREPEGELDYKNVEYLAQFIGPTGKIMARRRTGFSGQHQRELAQAIKLARFMGLLPYVGGIPGERERGDRGDRDRDRGGRGDMRRDRD